MGLNIQINQMMARPIMRYFGFICVGMLALILIIQICILGRLNDNAKRPVQQVISASPVYSTSPSASAIATEIRRQMAKDEPPSFSFQHWGSGASQNNNDAPKLLHVEFRMTRKAGPASGLSVKAETGIVAQIEKVQPMDSSNEDADTYKVSFKPEKGSLPVSWKFSISYTDHAEKSQERAFDVAWDSDKKAPADFQVRE